MGCLFDKCGIFFKICQGLFSQDYLQLSGNCASMIFLISA